MLDDILDNASTEESSLTSKVGLGFSSSSSTYLSASSSAAADRARLSRSTTLGFLLPQPKSHFARVKGVRTESNVDSELLHKLEEQNNSLPPQDSTSYLLARLERQNGLLDTDPKSVCIESNVLKGNLNTLHRLISDSTALNAPNSETIDWEFWGMLVQDYNAVASKLPHLLAARVRQGLPSKLRGLIWQSMSQASSTYLETMYTKLLLEHSPYERIIQRDLARTFPQVDMFKEEGGKGQESLRNILKAYSLYDPHMDEKEAFCVFVRLMETYDMRTMFTLNMEGLQLRLYQFSALLSEHLPMLHAHLSFHSINAAMYASQWFLSLFAYTYPLPLVLRVYDVVFTEGAPETIMRVAVAFLKKNEEKLMQLQEFEDLLDVLTSKLYDIYEDNAGEVIRDAMSLSTDISKEKLDALAMTYLAELEDQQKRAGEVTSKRFKDRFGSGHSTKAVETKTKETKATNSNTSSEESSEDEVVEPEPEPVIVTRTTTYGSDAMLLEQIQDLAKALSTLQRDHVEVTEGLVTAKMEK
ncbi:rab-GTPase-TBC domain-containing protein, partial [Linnemannia elongata]